MEMVQASHLGIQLLQVCLLGAEKAGVVAYHMDALRMALSGTPQPHLTVTTEEIKISSQLLRELAYCGQSHIPQVPVVLEYLEIILPCLLRSLRDIASHYEDKTRTKENRWRKMYHSMTEEVGGLPLQQRFILYNHFLALLRDLLTRSTHFDFSSMESLRLQIMRLREYRGIPPPPIRGVSAITHSGVMLDDAELIPTVHWAEQVFSHPLPCRTTLRQQHQQLAKSFGPHTPWNHVRLPNDFRVLFMWNFSGRRVSLVAYIGAQDQIPYFLLQTYHMDGPWYSLRGAHEIIIDRDGSNLLFRQWSPAENRSKLWATLCFMSWEELALMHCCFVSLKARNNLTINVAPEELTIRGERKLFQARIWDDGFLHSLIVYQDQMTRGLRLHAAVWDGVLRKLPVWTAFVTHQFDSPKWMKRVSKTKVHLADLQIYVFCQEYQEQNQRRGTSGAFEICFISEDAAKHFRNLFISLALEDMSTTTDSTTQS